MDNGGTNVWQFIVSVVVAVVFSDVAAVITTLIYQKHESKKARLTALQSLLNEVERVRKLVEHNADYLASSTKVRLPTVAFETAFTSGTPNLAVSSELLDAVTSYLVLADRLNTCIEICVAGVPSAENAVQKRAKLASREVGELCTNKLPGVLDQLSNALQRELG